MKNTNKKIKSEMNMIKKIKTFDFDLVLAHGPCNDGYVSAFLYYSMLSENIQASLRNEKGFYAESPAAFEVRPVKPTSIDGCKALRARQPVLFCFTPPQPDLPDELVTGAKILVLDLDMG